MAKIEQNLSEGSVIKQMVIFSIPFVLSSIVQNLYGLVDMIVVGQFSGAASLAGVNTSTSFVNTITNVAIGFCNGGTVVIGQYLGMKNQNKLREVIGTLCTFCMILAVVLMAATLALSRQILNLLQTPDEAYAQAQIYLIVCAIGFVFIFGYNLLSCILRGVGDSKRPFLFICVACAINVVLDVVLVGFLHLGALGAALATVFAQGISMVLCILFLKKNRFVFDFRLRSMGIHRESMMNLLRVGIPTTIQGSINVLAYNILTATSNLLGVLPSAAMAGAHKITLFAILPSIALGNATSAMCAQNFGADRQDRAISTMKISFLLTMGVNLVLFAVMELFPDVFMYAFGSDPEMIRLGVLYLRLASVDYLLVPFQGALVGYLIGSGNTVLPSVLSMVGSLLLRAPAAWIGGITLGYGVAGIAIATPLSNFVVAVFCVAYFLSGRCKKVQRAIKS